MSDGPLMLTAPATAGTWFDPDDDLAVADRMASLSPEKRAELLAADEESGLDLDELRYDFRFWGRPSQLYAVDSDAHITGILSGRGFGKQLDVSTPVPTPSGWTTMGALRPGDVVFDEQGAPTTVTWVSDPEVPRRAYRLNFSDGTFIDACSDHQWVTWTHRDRKQFLRNAGGHDLDTTRFPDDWASWAGDGYGPAIRTTQQIVDTFTQGSREDLNHCIPLAAPLDTPAADLSLDSWTLGYWLANGSARGGELTAGSKDGDFDGDHVEAMLAATGYTRFSRRDFPDKGQTRFNMPGLAGVLSGLGVTHDKHIPATYLRTSVKQRLALLRGLCDGDGYVDPGKSTVEYCSTDRRLADDILELVRTLGERPVLYEGRAKLNGVDYGPKYRVSWRPRLYNPFSLPRKAAGVTAPKAQALRLHHRMIRSYEPLDDPPLMRCITVDSPNSMYLAGEGMIPTHNTRTLSEIAHKLAERFPGSRGALVARTTNDTRAVLVKGESGLLETVPPDRRPKYVPNNREVTWPNGTVAHTFTASVPDMLRGPQFDWALCISRGTLVQTGRGSIPIEEVNEQDTVLVRDGRYVPLRMGARLTCRDADVVRIATSHQILDLTPDHGVATPEGWVEAQKLRFDDEILVEGLSCERVTSVEPAPRQDVFDLTTADSGFPEFFANGILVHNCDELAAWPDRPPAGSIANAWDNVKLATRLGNHPQIFVATTPRRVPSVIELINGVHADPSKYRVVRGATSANRHLADTYHRTIVDMYAGTSLARQELGGELLGDVEGALLRMNQIPRLPVQEKFNPMDFPVRIVAVDPSVAEKPRDECGIVVIVATAQRDMYRRKAFVVADESLHGSPGVWAKRAATLARKYQAFVVAEDNQGGEMVRMVIRAEDDRVPVVLARSEVSKSVRAEPVILGYERKQIVHIDHFGELEAQLTSWVPDESKYSPDRLDALVVGCSAAMVSQPTGMSGRIRLGRSPGSNARNRVPASARDAVPQHPAQEQASAAYRPRARIQYAREDRQDRKRRFVERRRRREQQRERETVQQEPEQSPSGDDIDLQTVSTSESVDDA